MIDRPEHLAFVRELVRIKRLLGWRMFIGLSVSAASLFLLLWVTSEVFEGEVTAFDASVRQFVHGLSNPLLTASTRAISLVGSPLFLVPFGIIAAFAFAFRRHRRGLVLFVIAMAGEIILDLTMKAGFMRPRPEPFFDYPVPGSFSYPSGHALGSLCFFGTLAWLTTTRMRSRWSKALVWSGAVLIVSLIGFSRIYLGVHYPSDVIAGYLTGLTWVVAVGLGDLALRRRTQTKHS